MKTHDTAATVTATAAIALAALVWLIDLAPIHRPDATAGGVDRWIERLGHEGEQVAGR
ncbi:MAG: hypothetical protein HY985_00140 [Magnetospirillum sp.]|nr:hypothetical protein [Magnetospirillum sp.]